MIPLLARDRLALSTARIGVGLALASVVGLALAYPAGVLVDRYGRKTVIVPSTVMAGVSLVLFVLAPSYAWFLVGCVAWSVASGVSGAAPATYAADVAPAGMNAAAISGYRMLSDLGYVIGPMALGTAADLSAPMARSGSPRCYSSRCHSSSGGSRLESFRPGRSERTAAALRPGPCRKFPPRRKFA